MQSLLTPTPPYPYEAVYTTGSAGVSTVNDFFLMAPISPGDASPPGVGPQILTLSMTVTGHTIADPAGATSPYANFKLSLSNDPTRSCHPTWAAASILAHRRMSVWPPVVAPTK